jgi:mandelate racemase
VYIDRHSRLLLLFGSPAEEFSMVDAILSIRDIRVRAVNAPLARPIRTAVGAIPSAPLLLIEIGTEQGIVGRSYLFAYTPAALAPLARLAAEISGELTGQPVVPVEIMRAFDRRFRLLGRQGLLGMLLSGLDMALWDALGRAAGWPVARLLGGRPLPLPAYDSYGIVDPVADERAIRQSLDRGFRAIKIKVGDGNVEKDVATVAAVRRMIGPGVALMVDYNQSLDPPEALRRIARLAEHDITWVEEPVPAEDIHGHARVRAGSAIRIQTGENWWFPRDMANAVAAGASDLAMLDIMKIGGVSGWVRAAGQAEAASLPVSSHIFVEASAHLLAVTPTAHWIEHLDSAGAIMAEPIEVADGRITAKGPGLGMSWDERAVARYAV